MSGRPNPGMRRPSGPGGLQRGATLSRGKTLSRPDRFQSPETMFKKRKEDEPATFWVICSRIVTCWALPPFMRMCGLHDKPVQQAWREKFTLCAIIATIGGMVAFLTLGFIFLLCPPSHRVGEDTYARYGSLTNMGLYAIDGNIYNFSGPTVKYPATFNGKDYPPAGDISNIFIRNYAPNCVDLNFAAAKFNNCMPAAGGCTSGHQIDQTYLRSLNIMPTDRKAGYDWSQMATPDLGNYIVVNGNVLNLDPYFAVYKTAIANDELDSILRHMKYRSRPDGGRDATKLLFRKDSLKKSASCLVEKFNAGFIDKATPGCFAADLFMYVATTVVMGIVLTRFAMAIIFDWFISAKLAKPPAGSKIRAMASSSSLGTNSTGSTVVGSPVPGKALSRSPTGSSIAIGGNPLELYTVMLVTCYSEGESSLRTTIESLAATEYPDNKKLLFIICDGIITGSGNDRSTPDICASLMELDPAFDSEPTPQAYIAVAAGAKQYNRAKVYAGYFRWKNRRVPTVLIVKCGGEEEQDKPKAGNRGKRDSQLILMNFFMR
ncbi:hypothetical protein BGX31_010938, partial [Mortierella sp. GBA43]